MTAPMRCLEPGIPYVVDGKIPRETPCVVCGANEHRPVMDHCHKHDLQRGVLCPRCNRAMHFIDTGRVPKCVAEGDLSIGQLVYHARRCPECEPVDPIGLRMGNWHAPSQVSVDREEWKHLGMRLRALRGEVTLTVSLRPGDSRSELVGRLVSAAHRALDAERAARLSAGQ